MGIVHQQGIGILAAAPDAKPWFLSGSSHALANRQAPTEQPISNHSVNHTETPGKVKRQIPVLVRR
jgi:hypothetical protein